MEDSRYEAIRAYQVERLLAAVQSMIWTHAVCSV